MWYRGTKSGVGLWFVLWGKPDTGYNADFYKTPYGLRNWLTAPVYRKVPVVRIGRVVLTPDGWEEKEVWRTREEFLGAKASD